jgi:hypothetical protein
MAREEENWNVGKVWSEMDVCDLKKHIEQGCSIEERVSDAKRARGARQVTRAWTEQEGWIYVVKFAA